MGKVDYWARQVVGGLHELDGMERTHDVAKDEELARVWVLGLREVRVQGFPHGHMGFHAFQRRFLRRLHKHFRRHATRLDGRKG